MDNSIEKSIEHLRSRHLLEAQEEAQGYVDVFEINLKPESAPLGWTTLPTGPVEAYRVTVDGVEGYLFTNEQDDYYRKDFYPTEYAFEGATFLRQETPRADRLRREEMEREEIDAEVHARQIALQQWRDEQQRDTLREGYRVRSELNRLLGPVFDLPESDGEYVQACWNQVLPSKFANTMLKRITEFQTAYGEMPTLLVPADGATEQDKLRSICEQLTLEEFSHKHGFYLKVAQASDLVVVEIYNQEDDRLSAMKAPLSMGSESVNFTDGENFDFFEELDVGYINAYDASTQVVEDDKVKVSAESAFCPLYDQLTCLSFAEPWDDLPNFQYSRHNGEALLDITEMSDIGVMHALERYPQVLACIKDTVCEYEAPSRQRTQEENEMAFV